jgi:hypothetical protein
MGASVDLRNTEEDKMDEFLWQVGALGHIVMDTEKRLCAVRGDLFPVQADHICPLAFGHK